MTAREAWGRGLAGVEAIALAMALGGLVTMGAIVAPAIFRNVPAPYSGDGMAIAFARYDRVALATLAVALVVEGARAGLVRRLDTWDRARLGCIVGAMGAAAFVALKITPAIAGLHAEGAMRGVGLLGERLDAIHRVAERAGKLELAFEAVALLLLTARR